MKSLSPIRRLRPRMPGPRRSTPRVPVSATPGHPLFLLLPLLVMLALNAMGQTTNPLRINCPPPVTNWICGVNSTAPVSYPPPTTTGGNCTSPTTVICSPPSGALFIVGTTTTVTCVATNPCGERATCSFTVTVARDTAQPVIQCPPNLDVTACSSTGVVVDYPVPAATDNAGSTVDVECVPKPGSVFPVGTTTVACTATDDCTNRTTCTFLVRVTRDTTPPVIQCPSNIVLWTCSTSAITHYAVIATDNLDTNVTLVCDPPVGTPLPVGLTRVTCTATDDCRNSSECSFEVRVLRDTTPPAIECPSNIVFNCVCPGNTIVLDFFKPTVTDDHDPNPTIVCVPPSLVSSPGVHVVTCTATDNCGNSNRCSFTVTFNYDTTAPALTCPTNMIVWSCSNSAVVNYSASATDTCDTNVALVCTPPSGSVFPAGTTAVVCTATDRCTNRNTCTFTVTVRPSLLHDGLCHWPLGMAALAVNASGELEVSNFGASGQDGVRIDLGESQGLRWVMRLPSGDVDGRDFLVWQRGGSPAGADVPIGNMAFAFNQGRLTVTPSAASYEFKLLLRGEVVHRQSGRTGSFDIPECHHVEQEHCVGEEFEGLNPNLPYCINFLTVECDWDTPSGPVRADALVVTPEDPLPPFTAITGIEIVGRSLPVLTLRSERLLMFGGRAQPSLPHRALGQARLVAEDGTLTLADLGSGGGDGVAVDFDELAGIFGLPAVEGYHASFEPVLLDTGEQFTMTASSRFTEDPTERPASLVLSRIRADLAEIEVDLHGDWIEICPICGVAIFMSGQPVGSATLAGPGPAATLEPAGTPLPALIGAAKIPSHPLGLQLRFDGPAVFTLQDGQRLTGDEIRVHSDIATFLDFQWDITRLELTSIGLKSFTIIAERLLPRLDLTCPPSLTLRTCSTNPVPVSFPPPVVTGGNCTLPPVVVCVPPSGSLFPPGSTTVQCTATNACGERAVCSFTVTVIPDTTPPVITCPSNMVFNCLCPGNTIILDFFQATATDDHDPSPTIVCNPPSLVSSPGVHVVTCTATDNCGNSNRCSFTVTFNYDTTPPAITCPTNMIVWSCSNSAVVNYSASATDACDANVALVCTPPSGSVFPAGTTAVVCTATDNCTNRSTCTFTVTVNRDTTPPTIICPTNVVASICSTCAVSQCVANVPPPIRPASVGNGLFYGSSVEPDMTFAEFSQQMDLRAEQGFHPIHVNAYQPAGESGTAGVKFSAAWVRDDDSAFAFQASRDSEATDLQFIEALQQAWGGSRLISLSGYKISANESRFTASFLQEGNEYPWQLILDRDFDQYQAEFEVLAAQGFRPISVSGYSFDGVNPRYSGIFVQDGLAGSDWVTAHRIAEADYQAWHDQYSNEGFQPISLSAYTIGEETFFTAVMVRVPNSGFYVTAHGMTESEFVAANEIWTDPANEHQTTFRPVVVAAYRSFYNAGAKRYAAVWRGSAPRAFTTTGVLDPSLGALDDAMKGFMQLRDINAATLCVSKNGSIVHHRGYNWAPAEFKQTQPCSRFRIASASKPIAAIAVMQLIEANFFVGMKGGGLQELTLDTPVFQINSMPDLPAAYGVEAQGITIRHLLQHRAGWDSEEWDPFGRDPGIAAKLEISLPLTRQNVFDYMMTPALWPINGDPSSIGFHESVQGFPPFAVARYSNFGFSLLARLVEILSNEPYETYVRNHILLPVGAHRTRIGHSSRLLSLSGPDEVTYTAGLSSDPRWYVSDTNYVSTTVENPTLRSAVAGGEPGAAFPTSPYGASNIQIIDGPGGWVSTSDDLVRLLQSFDAYNPGQPDTDTPLLGWQALWEMWSNPANTQPFLDNNYVLGWQTVALNGVTYHYHRGDIQGALALVCRRSDGVTFAALFSRNAGNGSFSAINNAIDSITRWPVCQDSAIVNFPAPITTDNVDANASAACLPPSGSSFPLGSTPVTCTATDNCGNSRTCTFLVTVKVDDAPPSIQCPTNRIVWTCSTDGAVVLFPLPGLDDDTDPNPSVVCAPPSGSLFPVGRTVVTCTATDECTNRSTCTFTVTVNADTVRPVIVCPADQTAWICGPGGTTINYPAPIVSDNHDPNPSVVCVPPSGSLFPVGQTLVTCTATDNCTNRNTCIFRVTVNRDSTPPEILCPANIIVWSCDANGVAVNYPAPTANDDSDPTPTVVCVPPSGSVFPHGVTIVTCTATDDCINRSSCSFEVRVARDTRPPTIVCPTNRIRYTCETAGGPAIYPPPDASDNEDPSPEVVCTPAFGDPLPLGTNVITCVVTDQCGNTNACSFTIDLRIDTIPPVIICPSNIVVNTCDPRGTSVSWPEPEVTDNFISNPQYSCTPKSGSVFPIGMTTVTCEARDSCGNRSSCTFKVTVIPDAEIPGTDTNGDGLSDIWQVHFNAQGLAPNDDSDGDGMTNVDEAGAGTNPLDPNSLFALEVQAERSEEGNVVQKVEMVFKTVNIENHTFGKLFQLQFTPKPGQPWRNLGQPIRGAGGAVTMRVSLDDTNLPPEIAGQAFFRMQVSDIDEDGDGITAWEESIIGTSDLTPNTHGNPGGDHQAAQDWIAGNAPQPRLREVALAHVGGSPNGPTQTKLVTATGTGGWLKLSSWTLNPGTIDPTHLQDTVPFEGWNAKLHVLEPPLSPTLSLNPFVSGRIREDQNLWLTTRRVDAVGAHTEFETIGYGANASFRVYDYAMAHRAVTTGFGDVVERFILVTPVMGRTIGGQKQLRVVTWSINPNTGDLNGLFDTGDLGHGNLPDDGGRLQIVAETAGHFVVSYVNSQSELSSWFFDVAEAGFAIARGGETSGLDIRGNAMDPVATTDFALGPLNTAGFATLLAGADCTARLAVWEDRPMVVDPAYISQPFYITDNRLDLSPNAPGIVLTPPTLTDSEGGANVRGLVSDAQWEQTYGEGAGELFLQMPPNEPIDVHAASVTKCMTLLLATEILDLPGINAALGDLVPVSANAANTGGSFMGDTDGDATLDPGERPLLEGDEIPLRMLLAGMMAPSCNKSSRAIAEYLGAKHSLLVEGEALSTDDAFDYFVGLMNAKADALQMNDTEYSHPAGGGVTTPQDLVTLWQEGWKHQLFHVYASSTLIYADCGTDAQGEDICFFVEKGTPWYPGLEAWKGGAGGMTVDGYDRPFCNRCILGQSTRLGRSLIAALQQSGDRSGDAARLWDYGYRLLFTPDYRGGGGINTPTITDFALRKIHDTLAVSAVIYGADQLRLDAWQVVAGIGQVGSLNNSTLVINNLPVGTHAPRTKILDVTKLPTVGESEADYLTGHLDSGDLRLNVWRVGAEPGQ